jgi:DNA-binding beta-propeller fold protein YncE
MTRRTLATLVVAGTIGVASCAAAALMTVNTVASDAPTRPPQFEVDAAWPKPLPNRWLMGQASGVAVDRHDHIWVVQRPKSLTDDEKGATLTPPRSICCAPAPAVLQFDVEGNLLASWGPVAGHPWPANEHGIYVDHQDNVWLAGNGPRDGMIVKFTKGGRHLLTIGAPNVVGDDADTKHLNRPANMVVDPQTNELFVADGYGNHRVIVFDGGTGAYRRHWGANGRPPGDRSVKGFATPVHCIRLSRDGLVYVCDRANNRMQVFKKDGTFVKEFVVAPDTRGNGSLWDADLSPDAAQTFIHAADGENNVVWNLLRDTGRVLGSFGRSGRSAGQFHWIHNIAVDSKGNVYTTEVDSGKRAQKFINNGRG